MSFPPFNRLRPEVTFVIHLPQQGGRIRESQLAVHTREQALALINRYAERCWQEECMPQATLDAPLKRLTFFNLKRAFPNSQASQGF